MSLFAHSDPSHPLIVSHPCMAELRRGSLIGLIVVVCSVASLAFDGWTRQMFPWVALLVALLCLLGRAQLIAAL